MLALASMLIASIACQIDVGGPAAPGSPIPVDPSQADVLHSIWQSAVENAVDNGQVIVTIDEAQMTAFLAERIADSDQPLIRNPQVYLRDNQIEIFGVAERGIFKANILIAVSPEITEDGEVSFELPEASIGPVPAPSALKNTISAVLTETLTGSVGTLATGLRISSLAIADGQMTIVGELR
jgi:hypothetical protein